MGAAITCSVGGAPLNVQESANEILLRTGAGEFVRVTEEKSGAVFHLNLEHIVAVTDDAEKALAAYGF